MTAASSGDGVSGLLKPVAAPVFFAAGAFLATDVVFAADDFFATDDFFAAVAMESPVKLFSKLNMPCCPDHARKITMR